MEHALVAGVAREVHVLLSLSTLLLSMASCSRGQHDVETRTLRGGIASEKPASCVTNENVKLIALVTSPEPGNMMPLTHALDVSADLFQELREHGITCYGEGSHGMSAISVASCDAKRARNVLVASKRISRDQVRLIQEGDDRVTLVPMSDSRNVKRDGFVKVAVIDYYDSKVMKNVTTHVTNMTEELRRHDVVCYTEGSLGHAGLFVAPADAKRARELLRTSRRINPEQLCIIEEGGGIEGPGR